MSERRAVTSQLILVFGMVLGLAAITLSALLWDRNQDGPVVIVSDPTLVEVVVEVRGAVATPGVYRLPSGGRVGEAIDLAGGPTEDADLATVNLARRLSDEELLVIPQRSKVVAGTPVTPAQTPATGISARINLNTASASELEQLPGVGEVLANRIVEYRVQRGPITSVDQLTEIDGISERMVDDIRDLVTV